MAKKLAKKAVFDYTSIKTFEDACMNYSVKLKNSLKRINARLRHWREDQIAMQC